VFAVSNDLRQHLVSEGFQPSQVDVVYNGIDPGPAPSVDDRVRARARLGVPSEPFVIGTVARLDPVKDLGVVIRAMVSVAPDAAAILVVIGDGPERAALERTASVCGVAERVIFLGHREDARELLPACDIYVNSSIFEGVSLTILEAMAAGLPVVATAVGGTPEIVGPETGVLVPARDPDSLARAMLSLMRNPPARETMGRAGRQAVESRFTLDRMVDDYVRVYTGEA
jgi:glycosyltransferase involved in cell wall biosynthesis